MNRRNTRSRQLAVGGSALALALGLATPALADGIADAVAAEVEGVVTIGQSSASTQDGEGEAGATALSLLGQDISSGSQSGEGSSSGELGGSGETPLGELSVAPWEADVEGDGSASSRSALADVTVIDADILSLSVLESRSSTSPDGGSADTTGVHVVAGGGELDLRVLHAEGSASVTDGADSSSAVAVVNGNGILTDEQTGGVFCPLDLMIVQLDVVCAAADALSATAGVVDTSFGGEVSTITSTAEPAAAPEPEPEPEPAPEPPAGGVEPDVAPAPDPLPTTGIGVLGLLAAGLGALGSGEYLRRRGR